MTVRSYSDMCQFETFEDRYAYLRVPGSVGEETFGFNRWVNQDFYRSNEWRRVRHEVIARDNGCDLGVPGYEIYDRIYIHHMNPMTFQDIDDGNPDILNPEYLISVTLRTHNAIHFGNEKNLVQPLVERRPGDTTLWRAR